MRNLNRADRCNKRKKKILLLRRCPEDSLLQCVVMVVKVVIESHQRCIGRRQVQLFKMRNAAPYSTNATKSLDPMLAFWLGVGKWEGASDDHIR
jgi:hypothetical protein